ncbi:ribosome biogenesis GTPase Der [Halovibrio salipaludis]|uniref:GTPase Der n=1 Tax=Halovibrio salipaludis TaxID=2032626 RepID=A0A2A2F7K5_9GAMM|nr:ribosome biogenesis GTPase Der [Halovibrio salipaludis]PAU80918.1 ribosome biogenesis GTPase Der [Halovibrio salipaludis]
MTPVIAVVGRPNVGKSTLFNQLTRSRDALVADFSGLTRDRQYGEGRHHGHRFIAIDTGGLAGDDEGVDQLMADQAEAAIEEADEVLLVVDGRAGLTPGDEYIIDRLRRQGVTAHLVVNKTDGQDEDQASAEFHGLGFDPLHRISAAHNRGIRRLLDDVLGDAEALEEEAEEAEEDGRIQVGIIGRPNVGKSTLVNRILGEDRVVVYDEPGTTRDSIRIPFSRRDRDYTLIDTAGVRRRRQVKEKVEKFSVVKTLQSIEKAHVVIAMIDAREGLVDQDMHLIGFALDAGRAVVVAVNKWDGMDPEDRRWLKEHLKWRLGFLDYARMHFISALHGTGVGDLYDSIDAGYDSAMAKWSTNHLTRILQDAVAQHPPPIVRGHRIKLRYAHQGGSCPPRIVVHGTQADAVPRDYQRYLENTYRRVLKVEATPIRFEFRAPDNPFEGRKNTLNKRQKQKKARLMQHVKKNEKQSKRRKKRG